MHAPVSKSIVFPAVLLLSATFSACDDSETPGKMPNKNIVFANHSVTPALVTKKAGFEKLEIYSLISSDDKLEGSPAFIFGGSADGSGLIKKGDSYHLLVNHEDNFAVSRITFDKTFKPVKGEYILNSDGGQWRLCSATLATPEEHGFGPVYLTCGESGEESKTNLLDPFDIPANASRIRDNNGLGRWSAENAVPLPKETYKNKTVILIGEDDDKASGGQLAMYVGNSTGDLDNGSLYMLKRADGNQKETDIKTGSEVDVEFVKIDNHKVLTGAEINARVDVLKAIRFGRVEDIDYRKGSAERGREIYFNATGQARSGVNADGTRTVAGRTYRLKLDPANPLKGKLELLLDGDDPKGPAAGFQNPDNICVTNNYVYIQEDANTYGTEKHDAIVYQYDINTRQLKPVLELDHRRTAPDALKYNPTGPSAFGSWEYGSLVDISDVVGVEGTFSLCIQPHSWRGTQYQNPDGGSKRAAENQASQIVLLKGLPK